MQMGISNKNMPNTVVSVFNILTVVDSGNLYVITYRQRSDQYMLTKTKTLLPIFEQKRFL